MSVKAYSHGRPTTRSAKSMVTSASPLASMAGARMLHAGGNAFDAIAAVAAALNVVEPFMSGLAGLGMATVYTAKDKQVRVLDFHPPVPKNYDAPSLTKAETLDGPNASGIPGNLAGWCHLASELGSLPLTQIFDPAISYAKDGYPTSKFFQAMVKTGHARNMQPEWLTTYVEPTNDGEINSVLRQPELAETLSAIASEGPGYLYGGPLGQKMIAHLQKLGGCMVMEDLESVEPFWDTPVKADFHGHTVHVPPPPAESFQFLLTLRILEGLKLSQFDHLSADHLDAVFRAIRLSSETRILNNGCSPERIYELLSDANIGRLQDIVGNGKPITARTEQFGEGPLPESIDLREHTTSFSAIDHEGNAVCITQSLGSMFGSGVVIPGTGVCMNNFMNWGDLNPASPNFLAAGKRLSMCLAPSMSLKGDEAALSLGTPGSYGILQTQAQAFTHLFEYELDLQAAIDAPRARLWDGRRVDLEARVEQPVIDELVRRGHEINVIDPFSMSCGGMHAISRDPATRVLNGAADSRRDGSAVPA